jgi:hypothetical protein
MLLDNVTDDYEWFQKDEVGYMVELHRQETEYNKAFAEYMGEEFKKEPLPLKTELESNAKHIASQLAALYRLKAPEELTSGYQQELEEVMLKIKNGQFSTTKSELEYYHAYQDKVVMFEYEREQQ